MELTADITMERYYRYDIWLTLMNFLQPVAVLVAFVLWLAEEVSPLVCVSYVLAWLMPVVGFILGIVVVTRPDEEVAKHGVWIVVVSVVSFVVGLLMILLLSAGSTTTTY